MKKYLWAFGIVALDLITIGLPIGSFFLAYVIVKKPKWFFEWLEKI